MTVQRRRLRLLLSLLIVWDLFFVTHWLYSHPGLQLGNAVLCLFAIVLGYWIVKTTPSVRHLDQLLYALVVAIIVGLNLTLIRNTEMGPTAVVLAATLISLRCG